jgi:hypothetical protein
MKEKKLRLFIKRNMTPKIMTVICKIINYGIENKEDERTITPEKYTEVTKYRIMKVLESVSGRKHACGFQR